MTTYKEDYKKMALSYQTELLQLKRKIAEDKEKSRSIILDQDQKIKNLLARSNDQSNWINNQERHLKDLETMLEESLNNEIMFKMVFFVVGLIIGIVLGCLL